MKVEYSKTNISDYEQYCKQNMIYFNETDYMQYCKEKRKKTACMALWFVMWVQVLYGMCDILNHKYKYMQMSNSTKGNIVVGMILIILLLSGSAKIIQRMFPLCRRMKSEMRFKSTMEVYFLPLYELQDVFRKGNVKRVEVDTKRSVLTAEINTDNGRNVRKYYLYGGYKAYFVDDRLDFTYIDKAIDEKVKVEGLHSY